MSGPAVHYIIAKEYLKNVLKVNYTDVQSSDFWTKMDVGDYAPIYNLGAQGPDFLFFNISDWPLGGVVKPMAQIYFEVADFIENFKEMIKNAIPDCVWDLITKLEGLVGDAVERSALLSELSDILGDVKNNINGLKALVETKIEEYITGSVDLFNLLSHPQQHGQKYSEWWWFDIMHIRRTGRFAKQLMLNSKNYSPERAYALGYLTHYTADITGHSFVNAISGGPYRTHSQRHKVVENHQDVWAYNKYYNDEFVKSELSKQHIVDGNDGELPDFLKDFILKCVKNTYYKDGNPQYGQDLKSDDLDTAYRSWLKWFSMATNDLQLPLPKPYSITAEIAEAWDKFTKNVGDLGDTVGNGLSGHGGILGFFEALAAIIAGPFILAGALIDFLAGESVTLAAAPQRYFLSLTYEALYNSYMSLRQGVSLNGFAFPTVAGLNHYMVKHMINTADADIFNHNANSLQLSNLYPSSKFKMRGMEAESHLIYPLPTSSNLEIDNCTGFPKSYYGKTPEWYMTNPRNLFNKKSFLYFKNFEESSAQNPSTAEVTANYAEFARTAMQGGLGNSLKLGETLYGDFLRIGNDTIFPDFCLDSDRGYAFKCWRKVKDVSFINNTVNDPADSNVPIENDKKVPNVQTDIIDSYGGAL